MVKKRPTIFERDVELGSLCKGFAQNFFFDGEAIIYARLSSKTQNGLSLESQKRVCENYCIEKNFNIIGTFFEVKSAKESSNQAVLLDIIERYQNINIIVNDASRFSRNFTQGVILLDKMLRKNIKLHCVDKNLVSSNNSDFKGIVSDFKDAETEIVNLGRRVRRSIAFKKSINTYFPSTTQFGSRYIKDSTNKIIGIEKEPNEADIIDLIKKLYYGSPSVEIENLLKKITGKSNHKIYDYVNDIEIQEVKYGNLTKKNISEFLNYLDIFRRGKKWTSNSISRVLVLE